MGITRLKLMHQKKSNIIFSIIFTICTVPSFSSADTTGNLITNGNFNNGTTGWTLSGDAQRINDCCPGGHDLEFGDSGSIEQSFDLLSNTITQPMLDNGITLNSSVEVQNGECGVAQCWGGSGPADTFTIRLQIRDINDNVLSVTTQERTNVTGINGKDFTDSVSFSGTGSNQGNIFISGADGNSPANLGGPNVDNISVTMDYDSVVLSATETAIIATAFEEIEEVLSTEIETVEFIPIEEFVFEVFEEPEITFEMIEEITFEEIAVEEINTGIVEIFTVAIEEEIIPMEVTYEEPKAIETFTTEIQGFEERTETSEVIQEFFAEAGEAVIEAPNSSGIVERESTPQEIGGGETTEASAEEIGGTGNGETSTGNETTVVAQSEQESGGGVSSGGEQLENETVESESVVSGDDTSSETETEVASEEVNETNGETETVDSEQGSEGTEVASTDGQDTESSNAEVEESRDSESSREINTTVSVESIERKVNETIKRVDQRLITTSLIVAKAMESPLSIDNYGQTNNNIFKNQPNIDGGDYYDEREFIDVRNIYNENQSIYGDIVAEYQETLQTSIDNRIRAEEHLRRIRGY